MACKCCLEVLLKLLNMLLTLTGFAIVGYGIYLLVEYKNSAALAGDIGELIQLGRPMLISLNTISLDLPTAWFIYLFIGIGVILLVISCFGCIGYSTGNGCCLCFYSLLILLLMVVEIGFAAFIYFDKNWKDDIPLDKTENLYLIYMFLRENWKIAKWVSLGAVILQALVFLLALVVRAMNSPYVYDSDDEIIAPRQQLRQPFIQRQPVPPPSVSVTGIPARNDAWSARMREKYGLDTSEFAYQQPLPQQIEERSRCVIM